MRFTLYGKGSSYQFVLVVAFVMLLSLGCGWPLPVARADDELSGPIPVLRPVRVFEEGVWFFDFDVPRGPETPALAKLVSDDEGKASGEPVRFYLFGVTTGANRPGTPMRWDMIDGILYCTYTSDPMERKPSPSILRYGLKNLIARPDDGRGAQDLRNYTSPLYASCAPIGAYRSGFTGWNTGDALARNGLRFSEAPREIHYDIRALDATHVELYVTADGKLSRWLFDGTEWTFQQHYETKVAGPFLIRDDGESLVTARDGRWCLLKGIDTKNPSVTPIIDVSETKPLRLIEDRSSGEMFFELAGDIFDTTGKRIARIPKTVKSRDRVREIVRNVRAQRE